MVKGWVVASLVALIAGCATTSRDVGASLSAPQAQDSGQPTAAQRAAADRLATVTAAATVRYTDPGRAAADGYQQMTHFAFEGLRAAHFGDLDAFTDHRILDASRPEMLMYLRAADDNLVLLGVLYAAPAGQGRAVGGPLTHWHVHPDICAGGGGIVPVLVTGACPVGTIHLDIEMLHAWVVPNPDGTFAYALPVDAAAVATGERSDAVAARPLIDEALIQDAVAAAMGITPADVRAETADRWSVDDGAATHGVAPDALRVAAAEAYEPQIASAVASGELPRRLARALGAFLAQQIDILLAARAGQLAADSPYPTSAATDLAYPCLDISCVVRPR
ncbi:MAG: hypothetical protein M3295_09725 [Chloroflexota bacterium]|nr:hypothetical protein [Chloroflexota bacterium]